MPRPNLIRTDQFPYHIMSRSNNKEWFYIPIEDVWYHSKEVLKKGIKKFNIELESFVLMNNHYHMLLRTPDSNLDKFMQFFNKKLGERISRQAERINRIFGAPYKWNIIEKQSYHLNVFRYIYQNPIRAKIVQHCEHYPFSTLRQELGFEREAIPLKRKIDDEFIDLNWLNLIPSRCDLRMIKRGLKRSIYEEVWDRTSLIKNKK